LHLHAFLPRHEDGDKWSASRSDPEYETTGVDDVVKTKVHVLTGKVILIVYSGQSLQRADWGSPGHFRYNAAVNSPHTSCVETLTLSAFFTKLRSQIFQFYHKSITRPASKCHQCRSHLRNSHGLHVEEIMNSRNVQKPSGRTPFPDSVVI